MTADNRYMLEPLPFERGRRMAQTTYTRTKGKRLTYEIAFDEEGYIIRRDGETLARGGAGA